MGLYGQRCGALSIMGRDKEEGERLTSQLKIVTRPIWSNPPLHGARIAEKVLNTPELYALWLTEIEEMAVRISTMRNRLSSRLKDLGSPHDWSHIHK
jgi:aspartate aminotransferase